VRMVREIRTAHQLSTMTDQHYYRLTDPRELGILLVRSCL
jgi:hypothetical protein